MPQTIQPYMTQNSNLGSFVNQSPGLAVLVPLGEQRGGAVDAEGLGAWLLSHRQDLRRGRQPGVQRRMVGLRSSSCRWRSALLSLGCATVGHCSSPTGRQQPEVRLLDGTTGPVAVAAGARGHHPGRLRHAVVRDLSPRAPGGGGLGAGPPASRGERCTSSAAGSCPRRIEQIRALHLDSRALTDRRRRRRPRSPTVTPSSPRPRCSCSERRGGCCRPTTASSRPRGPPVTIRSPGGGGRSRPRAGNLLRGRAGGPRRRRGIGQAGAGGRARGVSPAGADPLRVARRQRDLPPQPAGLAAARAGDRPGGAVARRRVPRRPRDAGAPSTSPGRRWACSGTGPSAAVSPRRGRAGRSAPAHRLRQGLARRAGWCDSRARRAARGGQLRQGLDHRRALPPAAARRLRRRHRQHRRRPAHQRRDRAGRAAGLQGPRPLPAVARDRPSSASSKGRSPPRATTSGSGSIGGKAYGHCSILRPGGRRSSTAR